MTFYDALPWLGLIPLVAVVIYNLWIRNRISDAMKREEERRDSK